MTKREHTPNTSPSNSGRYALIAIDRRIERNIILPTESKIRGRDAVSWGEGNKYPDYLMDLYRNCNTLKSVIDGCVRYIKGDSISLMGEVDKKVNRKGETITDIVNQCAYHYLIFGGFAMQVIRTKTLTGIAEIYAIDPRYLRTNEDGDVYYYSEQWGTGYIQDKHMQTYPVYMPDVIDASQATSIIAYKDSIGQVYPAPLYTASVKACEIERDINTYHLNELDNGFAGSALINFNNGIPDDEQQDEIEKNVNAKFSGADNAGRILLNFSNGKDNAAEIVQLDVKDFSEKYQSLAKRSRQEIFTAFRCNPNLMGIPTESLGFSSEEYDSAFRLFNRTQIQPIQQSICDVMDKIYQQKGCLQITPFSLEYDRREIR